MKLNYENAMENLKAMFENFDQKPTVANFTFTYQVQLCYQSLSY